jgi:hypothetical protein
MSEYWQSCYAMHTFLNLCFQQAITGFTTHVELAQISHLFVVCMISALIRLLHTKCNDVGVEALTAVALKRSVFQNTIPQSPLKIN